MHPSVLQDPAPAALAFSQAQFQPSASAGGTHTIDAKCIKAKFGYSDSMLPRGIAVTQGFALIAERVEILATSGNAAVTLYEKSYLLGDGGRLVGGSSSQGTAAAVSRKSRLRNGDQRFSEDQAETNEMRWEAVSGGTIVVHACSFFIGADEAIVRASLADGGQL